MFTVSSDDHNEITARILTTFPEKSVLLVLASSSQSVFSGNISLRCSPPGLECYL